MTFGPVSALGDHAPGKTLIARTGGVVPWQDLREGSDTFQWLRNGQEIDGETYRTYTVKPEDAGEALSVRYGFETHKGQHYVTSKPQRVPDPVREALVAIYFLIFARKPDDAGMDFYRTCYRNGLALSAIVADMERNKAKGAK